MTCMHVRVSILSFKFLQGPAFPLCSGSLRFVHKEAWFTLRLLACGLQRSLTAHTHTNPYALAHLFSLHLALSSSSM